MEKEKEELMQYVADTIIGRPYGFSVRDKHFFLYPVTLGKMFLLQRQIESLDIRKEILTKDVSMEALRLAKEKRDECLTIICYHTCNTPEEIFDSVLIDDRKKLFDEELSEEDIAALLIIVLTADKTSLFMKELKIDKENDRLSEVSRIKNKGNKNSLTFGGLTQFGTLLDAACERYGWTKQYVVWGIDIASLRLMLADKVTSVYLSDEEWKRLPASVKNKDVETIKPTKENMKAIMDMDWS